MLYLKKHATTDTTIFLLWVLHQTYCALHVVAFVSWDYEINENNVVGEKSLLVLVYLNKSFLEYIVLSDSTFQSSK